MTDGGVWIRPFRPQDRPEAVSLAVRLQVGVAPWRDPDAVRDAVIGWVRGSVDSHTAEDREVFGTAGLVGIVAPRHYHH